ncbi:MAG: NfeD family protein [Planctomycetes bacterium]|nr:NfeD family protein [Planctomycetota bacterium]
MDLVEIIYLGCFFLGLGFAVLSGLLSGVFSGHAAPHLDVGDAATGDLHPTMGGEVHFPLLSPVTVSMFISTFGGSGYIYRKMLGLPDVAGVPLALGTALTVAFLVAWFFYKIFQATQGSSEAHVSDLIGLDAEVITPIPADGVGEIAYTSKEARFNAPARTPDGKPLPARALVRIVKIVGGTYVVEKVR